MDLPSLSSSEDRSSISRDSHPCIVKKDDGARMAPSLSAVFPLQKQRPTRRYLLRLPRRGVHGVRTMAGQTNSRTAAVPGRVWPVSSYGGQLIVGAEAARLRLAGLLFFANNNVRRGKAEDAARSSGLCVSASCYYSISQQQQQGGRAVDSRSDKVVYGWRGGFGGLWEGSRPADRPLEGWGRRGRYGRWVGGVGARG